MVSSIVRCIHRVYTVYRVQTRVYTVLRCIHRTVCIHGVYLGSIHRAAIFVGPIAFSRYLVLGAQYIHRVYVENYGELSITLYVQRSILGVYLGSHLLNPHSYPELCKPDGTYAVFIW
jgi:hypothetical protein